MQGEIIHFLEEIILIFNKKIDEVLSTQTIVRPFHKKKVFSTHLNFKTNRNKGFIHFISFLGWLNFIFNSHNLMIGKHFIKNEWEINKNDDRL